VPTNRQGCHLSAAASMHGVGPLHLLGLALSLLIRCASPTSDHAASAYHVIQSQERQIRVAADVVRTDVEDLGQVEEMEKQAARAAKRAELMQPSLDRAMKAEESKRQDAARAIIEAAQAEHQRIMGETYAAIDTLVSLVAEHRELEGTVRRESKAPSHGPGQWSGFGYGPAAPIIGQLAEWARFVRQSE